MPSLEVSARLVVKRVAPSLGARSLTSFSLRAFARSSQLPSTWKRATRHTGRWNRIPLDDAAIFPFPSALSTSGASAEVLPPSLSLPWRLDYRRHAWRSSQPHQMCTLQSRLGIALHAAERACEARRHRRASLTPLESTLRRACRSAEGQKYTRIIHTVPLNFDSNLRACSNRLSRLFLLPLTRLAPLRFRPASAGLYRPPTRSARLVHHHDVPPPPPDPSLSRRAFVNEQQRLSSSSRRSPSRAARRYPPVLGALPFATRRQEQERQLALLPEQGARSSE